VAEVHPLRSGTATGINLDPLIDGAHIARENAGVRRQRDHRFAQGFTRE